MKLKYVIIQKSKHYLVIVTMKIVKLFFVQKRYFVMNSNYTKHNTF